MMDKAEFFEQCRNFSAEAIDFEVKEILELKRRRSRFSYGAGDDIPVTAFMAVWRTGGYIGGNCMNDDVPYFKKSNTPEAELESLDKFLNCHFPDVPYKLVRQLERKVVREELSQSEYYGNTSDYVLKSLEFEDVWVIFEEAGLVTD